MTIVLNGEPFEVASPVSLAELIGLLGRDQRLVAVTHNERVVRRGALAAILLAPGDRVEIVRFTGGG
jgi:sulfur carrier protein